MHTTTQTHDEQRMDDDYDVPAARYEERSTVYDRARFNFLAHGGDVEGAKRYARATVELRSR